MVLYINGNYPHHSLHGELVTKLADLGHEICVYIPTRGSDLFGKYDHHKQGVELVYSDVLTLSDRVFFKEKIRKLVRDIEKKIDMAQIDCILAGTVYSDGIPAYLLSQKYGIPFSVVVRNTDINTHMKWRPYLDGLVKKVLSAASKVVCISPSYQVFFDKYEIDKDKFVCIPNAINDFWFCNGSDKRSVNKPLVLIYVGEITDNKNLKTSIRVVRELNTNNIDSELHVIGSGDKELECKQLASKLGINEKIHFHGWKNGLKEIKAYYDRADIFVMPSFKETFGTVYVEALSQGLPVIYTKGQGIDGYFPQGEIGYACEPTNVSEITVSIKRILENYNNISEKCVAESYIFRWDAVAKEYSTLIKSMR